MYSQTLVCGNTRTTRHVQPLRLYQSLRIQLVQNAPDDGPMRSETCRANISAEKTYSLRPHCVSCWTTYILQDDTRSLQCEVYTRGCQILH